MASQNAIIGIRDTARQDLTHLPYQIIALSILQTHSSSPHPPSSSSPGSDITKLPVPPGHERAWLYINNPNGAARRIHANNAAYKLTFDGSHPGYPYQLVDVVRTGFRKKWLGRDTRGIEALWIGKMPKDLRGL